MTNNNQIDVRVVLDYCLNRLPADQRSEFESRLRQNASWYELVKAVQKYLDERDPTTIPAPDKSVKDKIWLLLHNVTLEKQMDPHNLPLLNKYTDPANWMKATKGMVPDIVGKVPFMKVLTATDNVFQVLIKTISDIPEETHEDVHESFIILEGECECRIGDDLVRVKAGEFLEIPLHAHHDVRIVSDYVVGIMQRVKVA